MGFAAGAASIASIGLQMYGMSQAGKGGVKVPFLPEISDEEMMAKLRKRQNNIRWSAQRFSQRQATLGPVQLQAPTLGGIIATGL